MSKENDIVGFKKDGLIYLWCKRCERKYEKFVSTEKIISPESGELMYASFNGIDWALKNGFNPIYKK